MEICTNYVECKHPFKLSRVFSPFVTFSNSKGLIRKFIWFQFLSIWTIFTSGFDIYCLHEASPGTEHTGYYIISFDFVYVGNAHIRGLLIMSSVFSLLLGIGLFITNVLLLDGLRKEQESGFKGWLWIMGIFTPWKILAWGFAGISISELQKDNSRNLSLLSRHC